ncbi:MAG: RAD52 family DNA repair protein, partial [Chloroflexota bacterium]|nr:RAD52 family DNA repair protein [Chloroflexota bacterium]
MSDQKLPDAILKALGEPFPRAAVKSRQGAGNKQFKYVEAETVIRRLNSATNGAWDFRIVSVDWRGDVMLCQGELTIPGLGTRTGFGVQKVVPNSGEDLLKGASSDALKKSATLFGV